MRSKYFKYVKKFIIIERLILIYNSQTKNIDKYSMKSRNKQAEIKTR